MEEHIHHHRQTNLVLPAYYQLGDPLVQDQLEVPLVRLLAMVQGLLLQLQPLMH